MNCNKCQRLLTHLREGDLSAAKARAVKGHLSTCSACREVAEEERGVIDLMESFAPPPLPPSLHLRLIEAVSVAAKPTASSWPSLRLPQWAFAPVAAVLLVALGFAWWGMNPSAPETVGVVVAMTGEVEVRTSDVDAWHPVQPGTELPAGSQVMSRERGMVVIETTQGSTISAGPESIMRLQGPDEIASDRGNLVAETQEGFEIHTPEGMLRTGEGVGRLGLSIRSDVHLAITGGDITWAPGGIPVALSPGPPVALNAASMSTVPTAMAQGEWGWLGDLNRIRARQLLRETHPSLLP